MYIGILGLVLLAVSWSAELYDVITSKKSKINTKFAIIYSIGSFLLTIHAIQISDYVFMILNAVVTILSLVSLWYSLK